MTKDEALKKALDDLILEYHMETSSFAKRVDEIFEQAPPAQRQWVGLTAKDVGTLVELARRAPADVPCPDYNERLLALANDKLKELNT